MDKNDIFCALCKIPLKDIKFNLKTHESKFSRKPLMPILESTAGNLSILHCDICVECYDLLNELDAIECRQTEIKSLFKKYLELEYPIQTIIEDLPGNLKNDLLESKENTESDLANNQLNQVLTKPVDSTIHEVNNSKLNKVLLSKKNVKNPKILKPHKCHCSKEFRTARELKNHMNTHNDHAFICEICGMSYRQKTAFNIHMDMHKGINPFVCVYCNKSFTQKGALVRHVPIHTGEMPYQCDKCGKRFVHHTSFNVHKLSHTGLKSFKCDLCGLTLMSGSHLKRHHRKHTGEKKFACETCGKRFAERYNLVAHEKVHTNPSSTVSQGRSYSCQVCGKSFKKKVKLEQHLAKEHQILWSDLDDKDVLKKSLPPSNDSYHSITRLP